MRRWRIILGATGLLLFVGGWANFAVFIVISLVLGGTARNGTAVDGHYYLANRSHRTEVSERVWRYSVVHGAVTRYTHTGMFIGFGMMFLPMVWSHARQQPARAEQTL